MSASLNLSGGAFVVDSTVLTPQAKTLLDQAAEVMREYPEENIRIHGHTDSTGSHESNLALSERRANTAYDYLVDELGLAPPQGSR